MTTEGCGGDMRALLYSSWANPDPNNLYVSSTGTSPESAAGKSMIVAKPGRKPVLYCTVWSVLARAIKSVRESPTRKSLLSRTERTGAMAALASSSVSGLVSTPPCFNQLRSSRQSFACSTAKCAPQWMSQRGTRRETEKRCGVRCAASSESKVGFFGKLSRVIKEKAKGDIDRLFNGFSKTRENLSVVDELLTYWNLTDSENTLDELEEVGLPVLAELC